MFEKEKKKKTGKKVRLQKEIKDLATWSRCHKTVEYLISLYPYLMYMKSANDKSHLYMYHLFDPPHLITISRNETDAS